MRPVVGVVPLWDDEKESIWMLPGYLDGISEAGAIPITFPLRASEEELAQLVSLCDGLLITGGQDVSPELYGETPLEGLVETCVPRDILEHVLLRLALEDDMPLLGICRGIQFVNVDLGGTLYQDLPSQHPSEVTHSQLPPYDVPAHEVEVLAGTPLHACLGVDRLPVNSCHHQAVRELAPGLEPMAISTDGLVEALWRPTSRFLWAVQWHPEFSHRVDESSRRIFTAFVEAMA